MLTTAQSMIGTQPSDDQAQGDERGARDSRRGGSCMPPCLRHAREGKLCLESPKDRRIELKGNRDHKWMCLRMGTPRYRTSTVSGHSREADFRPICLKVTEVVNLLTPELTEKNLLKPSQPASCLIVPSRLN